MIFKKTQSEPTDLEIAIARLFDDMAIVRKDSEEYAQMADQMTKLYKLKEVDSNVNAKKRVSPDTWAIVGGNILGIVTIVSYERTHAIASKAIGFVLKAR